MAIVVSQHVRHIDRHLGFFENFLLRRTAANFTEISRKHVFAASNTNTIKNIVKKRNYNKFSQKFNFLISNLNLHN